jgi:uncharacterized integral membrane protein
MRALFPVFWRGFLLVLRLIIFILFFLIAITNHTLVEFHWFLERSVQVPLNVLLLGAFLTGLIIAVIALNILKSKRTS